MAFKKSVSIHVCIIVGLFCFGAGLLLSPGTAARRVSDALRYNKGTAQRLYHSWKTETLLLSNGERFSDFVEKNQTFAIYFWATWCPHCENVAQIVEGLNGAGIQMVGMTFDTEREKYDTYRREKPKFWRDVFLSDGSFVPRENEFNVPSIPSAWIIQNGKVKKIFIGEKGIANFAKWFEKNAPKSK